jgi:hypothetical protein
MLQQLSLGQQCKRLDTTLLASRRMTADVDISIFDPDSTISTALLSQLASATSTSSTQLCKPFVRPGIIIPPDLATPIPFEFGLLDTGAQGSNFIAQQLYLTLPPTVTSLSRSTNRIVRLGDARSLPVQLEVPLTIAITDSQGYTHQHNLWFSVLSDLSHDLIIGLPGSDETGCSLRDMTVHDNRR